MENIAIIPARSGSKGLPDKNIKELNGKPLMAYSIEAAIQSECFDTVMVSTDSEQYAQIGIQYGAEVPFLRSTSTSTDSASSWDVVEEVLQEYEKIGHLYESFCLLQPTSPLRTSDDIIQAYELFKNRSGCAVISMTEIDHPIEWCGRIDDSLSLDGFCDRDADGCRQQMSKMYRPNGAIYIASIDEFRKDRFLYRKGSYAYIMPRIRSVDIDTKLDFRYAGFLMSDNDYCVFD